MKRTLKLERLFYLGDYRNIKFIDEITDLPEDVAGNETALDLLRQVQFVGVDKAFQEYMALHKSKGIKNAEPEEAIIELEKIKEQLVYELTKVFGNGKLTDNEDNTEL